MRTSSQREIDFTSARYLGLRHGSEELSRFRALTTGYPAALHRPALTLEVEFEIARLQRFEHCVLGTSTLHLYCDLAMALPRRGSVILDSGAYAVAGWAAKLAAGRGLDVSHFQHGNLQSLARELARARGWPIVLMDGYCIQCGARTPLREAEALVERYGGVLAVDATQSFGVLGEAGAGLAADPQLSRASCVSVASLAKGFAAPVAALCHAPMNWLSKLRERGTQVHCSPPNTAALLAARRALAINRWRGDVLRVTVRKRVALLQAGLRDLGLEVSGGPVPVLCVAQSPGLDVVEVQRDLQVHGIKTVVLLGHTPGTRMLAFVLRASHSVRDVERCLNALSNSLCAIRSRLRTRAGGPHRREPGPRSYARTQNSIERAV